MLEFQLRSAIQGPSSAARCSCFLLCRAVLLIVTFYPESWSPGRNKIETVLGIRFLFLKKTRKGTPHPRECETVASMGFDFSSKVCLLPRPSNRSYYKAAGSFALIGNHRCSATALHSTQHQWGEARRAGGCLLYLCCEHFVYRVNHYAQQAKHSVKIIRRTCHELKMNNCWRSHFPILSAAYSTVR